MSIDRREAHDLIERLCNLMRTSGRSVCNQYGMRSVQLEALDYLTQCNRFSDTPQAVTEYLGLTKGTVSQTLKVLESKGMLNKQGDPNDKRQVHLKPTTLGREVVERAVPASILKLGLENLPDAEQQAAVGSLRALLRSMQHVNSLQTFAPCKTCRFNKTLEDGYLCELTQESLSEDDVELLCREHQY